MIIKIILPALLIDLSFLSFADADNRLFPTDILNKGEVDARLSVGNDHHSENVIFHGNPGTQSSDLTRESIQVRYGLGANWHIGARLPYVSHGVSHTDFSNPPAHFSSEIRENPFFLATYGIVNDATNPFTLNGELLIHPNVTGKITTYSGRLTTGWKSSDTLKLFASDTYTTTTRHNPELADSNTISFGAYKDISKRITLIPEAHYSFVQRTDKFSSFDQYGIGLSSNIQIFQNTYLVPEVGRYWNSSGNSVDGFFHRDAVTNGTVFYLALYHLF